MGCLQCWHCWKVRQGAPLATYSIDRRCIYNYEMALRHGEISSLVCFCCARRYPYMRGARASHIQWVVPFQDSRRETFMGLLKSRAQSVLGLESYPALNIHCSWAVGLRRICARDVCASRIPHPALTHILHWDVIAARVSARDRWAPRIPRPPLTGGGVQN